MGLDLEKQKYLESFFDLRPDLFLPENFTAKQKEIVASQVRQRTVRTNMFSSIPMQCRAAQCQFADTCPLFAQDAAPEGSPCQPPGEMIMTYGHGEVAIEDLDPLIHRVYGWERKYSAIRKGIARNGGLGFKFAKQEKQYSGTMTELTTYGGLKQKVTNDHVAAARFTEKAFDKFVVYLMRKGDFWRVGKSRLAMRSTKGTGKCHLTYQTRGAKEGADAMWILGVYDTNVECLLAEEAFSIQYGISKALFIATDHNDRKYDGLYTWISQEQLDAHHKLTSKDEHFFAHMLDDLGLDIRYPIWQKGGFIESDPVCGPYPNWPFFIRACNLLPGYMEVPLYEGKNQEVGHKTMKKSLWDGFNIYKYKYTGPVYSLDVEVHKTYFSGGIATHNCPLEGGIVYEFMTSYMEELDVDPENLIEVGMIRDLVDQEVQYMRKTKVLAQDHFIQENVAGLDADGNVQMRKELHQAVDFEDRLHKRRKSLRDQLLASRESRAKAGGSVASAAKSVSDMIDKVRALEKDKERAAKVAAGSEWDDDYINNSILVSSSDDE